LAKLVAQEQHLINDQTLVNSGITLRKLVILPRMDAKMDESLVEAMVDLCEETSSLEMVSGCSYLQGELVSLKRTPEICVRWRRRLAETQRGRILTVYVLSFGLASTQKAEWKPTKGTRQMRGSGRTEELTKPRVKNTSYGVSCS